MADTSDPFLAPSGAWREPPRPGSSGAAGLGLAIHRQTDQAIVELWRGGVRGEGEIGRRLGLDQRSVSRHICRMVRLGTWPFGDRPARGRVRVPIAAGFVAIPIRVGRVRAARRRPEPTTAPASA